MVQYSIGCTATYVTTAGTIAPDQNVCVRQTSAATLNTATDTVLTVDTVSDTFTSTTIAADTTPDAFAFVDQTNVAISAQITSTPVTISGINAAANGQRCWRHVLCRVHGPVHQHRQHDH